MAGTGTLKVALLTPKAEICHIEAVSVTAPSQGGEVTVLPMHRPLLAALDSGVVRIVAENGETQDFSISGGFLSVKQDSVRLMADSAELKA